MERKGRKSSVRDESQRSRERREMKRGEMGGGRERGTEAERKAGSVGARMRGQERGRPPTQVLRAFTWDQRER